MHNSDELLRNSHAEITPTTPPQGQWGRIRAGLDTPPPAAAPSLLPKYLAVGLVGGGVLLSVLYFTAPASPPPVTSAIPETLEVDRATLPRVAVLEERDQTQASAGASYETPELPEKPDAPTPAHLIRLAPPGISAERSALTTSAGSSSSAMESEVEPRLSDAPTRLLPSVAYSSEDDRVVTSASSVHRSPRRTDLLFVLTGDFTAVTSSRAADALTDALPVAVDPSVVDSSGPSPTGSNGWIPTVATQQPPARWEVGLHAGVSKSFIGGVSLVDYYSELQNDRVAETFPLDEETTPPLYLQDTEASNDSGSDVPLSMARIELARQFPTGLRLGLGLGASVRRSTLPSGPRLRATVQAGDYFRVDTKKYTSTYTTLSAGYTLRRRKRLQIGVGAILPILITQQTVFTRYLYSFDQDRYFKLSEDKSSVSPSVMDLIGQVNLQYHFNERISAGIDLTLPLGIGGGVRYKFY